MKRVLPSSWAGRRDFIAVGAKLGAAFVDGQDRDGALGGFAVGDQMKALLQQSLQHGHEIAASGLGLNVVALGLEPGRAGDAVVGEVEGAADDSEERGIVGGEGAVGGGEVPASLAGGAAWLDAGDLEARLRLAGEAQQQSQQQLHFTSSRAARRPPARWIPGRRNSSRNRRRCPGNRPGRLAG